MSHRHAARREEEALLKRLLVNDAEAWRLAVDQYSALLQRIARKTFYSYGFHASPQDAEDAAAEVWRNLVENEHRVLRNCLARGNFLQTLHVLARNRAVDLMRKRKIHAAPLEETHYLLRTHDEDPIPDYPPEMMAAALDRLNQRERTLVRLYFLQEAKYREIAELTGIPRNSIGATLCRALAKLRDYLSRHGGEPDF